MAKTKTATTTSLPLLDLLEKPECIPESTEDTPDTSDTPKKPENTIKALPVPERLIIEEGRVWIWIFRKIGKEVSSFQLPVQWTEQEAAHLIQEIKGHTWHLDEEGIPMNYELILDICEEYCNKILEEKENARSSSYPQNQRHSY